jgi:hypothetical protein
MEMIDRFGDRARNAGIYFQCRNTVTIHRLKERPWGKIGKA